MLNYEYIIKKTPLTITAESCSRDFGTKNPEFELSYDGFVNDEDEKVQAIGEDYNTHKTADVNGDGFINIADADYIIERIE